MLFLDPALALAPGTVEIFIDTAVAAVPPSGVTLLHGISAIGTKFKPSEELGPQSRRAVASGPYHSAVWLRLAPGPE